MEVSSSGIGTTAGREVELSPSGIGAIVGREVELSSCTGATAGREVELFSPGIGVVAVREEEDVVFVVGDCVTVWIDDVCGVVAQR